MAIKNKGGARRTSHSASASQHLRSSAKKRAAVWPGIALTGVLASAMVPGALAAAAAAQQPGARAYQIPAGELASALRSVAGQAGVMIIFTPGQAEGKTTPGLHGNYSVDQAFSTLLAGSGLQAEATAGGYRLIGVSPATAPADAVMAIPELSVVAGLSDSTAAGRSTLDQQDIDRVQADNVAALLDKLPGVSMAGSPRPGGQSLNIWGMGDMEDVRVVLDGAPKGFEKYRQGSVFIEPELLKRVSVDKGPHNIQNGNGGFGGTITMETKDAGDMLRPGEDLGGLVKYSYHTNDRQGIYSGALYGRTEEGFADGLIYASRRDGGSIKRPDGTRFAYSSSDQASYLLKTNLYLTDSQTLTLSAMRSESDGWQPFAAKRDDIAAPSQANIDRYGYDEAWRRILVYRDQKDSNYTAKWNLMPESQPLVNLTIALAYSKTEQHDKRPDSASQSSYLGTLGNESWVSYTDRQLDISNESLFSSGPLEHKLLLGAQVHKHHRDTLMYYPTGAGNASYNYGYFQPYYMPAGEQETRSVYLQDAVSWGDLTITPGVRYDHVTNTGRPNSAPRYNDSAPLAGHDYSSVTYTGWSPHLGAIWKATKNVSLFADLSRTWRAPVIDEQYEVQSAASSVPGTSRNLQVERIDGVRLGAVLDFNDVLTQQDSLQIRTTLFRNRGKNEIFYRRGVLCGEASQGGSCGQPLSNYRNLPGYTIEGVEVESFYDSERAFGSLSFSSIRGKRDASPRDPWANETWIAEIPPTTAHAMLGMKVPQANLAFGMTADFVRKQDRSPADGDPMASVWALPKTSGYALYGLFASWEPNFWKGLEARVTVDNLTNHDYYPYLGESVSGVGRNFKFSVSQRF
ncbi:TonB-dependent hemoglobin/transferrin/lactoferrin family receptor [Erwinia sp. E602]|uniref:TonB-dependent receptor n=1 Tax=Erwinia sp. E602 TaxID=2675378 RepID=UPI001BA453F7|nr:TonB-dependent hemoglobin/transferrin/lactoferrin family receptor [Erwinia sp. E602]